MKFGLLGTLLVHDGTAELTIAAGKQRSVLAALLLHPGEIVSMETLISVVWNERPPPGARRTIQSYVMRLRQALGEYVAPRVESRPPGYVMHVNDGELDLRLFQDRRIAAEAAARDGDWPQVSAELTAALAHWRGKPLADIPSAVLQRDHGPRLVELELAATELWIEAELRMARGARIVAELRRLTGEHPLREHFHAQLMLALYQAGRQGEALEAFSLARRALVDELGIEPGPDLQHIHHQILTASPDLTPETNGVAEPPVDVNPVATATARPGQTEVIPFQLPADLLDFTGRTAEVKALLRHLVNNLRTGVPIGAVLGQAGVGKTSLAVHAAHLLRHTFPDGILYVDLHGSGTEPLDPRDVLARFMQALGVPGNAVPDTLEDRAGLLRSALATRQMLMVLDNAADSAQVRPLLPASAGNGVIITSRSRIASVPGARMVELGALPPGEATELLARAAGGGQVEADRASALEVVRACGALPLAVRIAGTRLAARPYWTVADLADRLRERHHVLDELRVDDLDIRASFAVSYACLTGEQARAFRLLALLPVPDLGLDSAAALLGLPENTAERILEELVDASLLLARPCDRYGYHDLVRTFALEQSAKLDRPEQQAAALRALLEHLLEGMNTGLPGPRRAQSFRGRAAANWLRAEHRVMIEAICHVATRADLPASYAAQLSLRLHRVLVATGQWDDLQRCGAATMTAGLRDGDTLAEATATRILGSVAMHQGDLDSAEARFERALKLSMDDGDRPGEAFSWLFLGNVAGARANPWPAINHLTTALEIFEERGIDLGVTLSGCYLGEQLVVAGDPRAALRHLNRGLDLARQTSDIDLESMALQKLSSAHSSLGEHETAVKLAAEGMRLAREHRSRHSQAIALIHLGTCLLTAARPAEALDHLMQAARLCTDMNDVQRAMEAGRRVRDAHRALTILDTPPTTSAGTG
ncbi:AfsR/SARP family transcriptional regulator [Actinoallomurus sp. CA-150999]|uniref:AfsR/SARP family transcriptional regulator n=1 Tax=Actinoallomurus sp. CA-150999 TaxID=3239887 RepID=UPI003D8CD723